MVMSKLIELIIFLLGREKSVFLHPPPCPKYTHTHFFKQWDNLQGQFYLEVTHICNKTYFHRVLPKTVGKCFKQNTLYEFAKCTEQFMYLSI